MGILATVSGAGGDITPIFKFNAVQGRCYTVERVQGTNGWESFDQEVAIPVKFVADLAYMQVGQVAFVANRPDFHMVLIADIAAGTAAMPARPTPEHRSGFIVRIYAKSLGLREWRSQARCVLTVMDEIYDAYVASPEAAKGLLPVVEITGCTAIKREGQYPGTDMQPQMRIVQWVPRPADLPVPGNDEPPDDTESASPAPTATVTPLAAARGRASNGAAARPAAHVPPPRPTQTQVAAAQAMHAPPPPPDSGDDAEFV